MLGAISWTKVSCYAAISWEEKSGTCSKWGAAGYEGDVDWSGVRPYPVYEYSTRLLERFNP